MDSKIISVQIILSTTNTPKTKWLACPGKGEQASQWRYRALTHGFGAQSSGGSLEPVCGPKGNPAVRNTLEAK